MSTDVSGKVMCCFCYKIIRLEEDENAMRVRLARLSDLRPKQEMYTHSACLKERLPGGFDVWWE
ncbi:hypothetical protein ACQEVZ_07270 [Dactylosporangium sp. CA-152071]|uniref:hypothetical protein n=1 Tax=Dactylosporangium sp. CA-152071 TaxID=3239933 RepID=UPI003D94E543